MRLRRVGPGIGGLYYPNLLKRDGGEPRASAALLSTKAAAANAPSSPLRATWTSFVAAARRMGQALIEARMAQAERMVEMQTRRLADRDGGAPDRAAVGPRYY
jgi:hypothetical protein